MGHFRIFAATLAGALAAACAAHADDSTSTRGTADIKGQSGIEATGQVIFEEITIPSIVVAPMITTNSVDSANVSLTGETSVVSLAVPQSVNVATAGNAENLTVMTELGGEQVGLYGMESLIGADGTLSVDIGGMIAIRPEDLAPGEYRGLLVVVAQYN